MKPKSILTTLAFCALASGLQAATLYWDGGASTANSLSDNTTSSGLTWLGSGITAGNWDNGGSSAPLASWNPGDSAIFGGAASPQTVTAGTQTIGDLTFGGGGDGTGTTGTNYTISGGTITFSTGSNITTNTATSISSSLAGAGSLTKRGDAMLTLTGTSTVIGTGTFAVNNGTVKFSRTGNDKWGSGLGISISTGTTFEYAAAARLSSGAVNITGAGTFKYSGSGTAFFANGTNYQAINMSAGGKLWVAAGSTLSDYNVKTTNLGDLQLDGTLQQPLGNEEYFDAFNGASTGQFIFTTTTNGFGLRVGVNNGNGNFAGVIKDGVGTAGGFTKVGTGTQILSGANTYTKATLVSGGTLVVDGSLTNSAVTVNANGTLAGIGSVKSASVSGTVSPGGSAIGKLTVSNALALNSGSTTVCQIDKTGNTLTADQLFVNSVSYGGTLSVTATGATLLPGDTFQLFSALPGFYSGIFSTYNLPTLSAGYNWDISGLLVDGSIKVVNFAPTPAFTPVAGSYLGAQTITMNSGSATTVYYTYTTNGIEPADPTTSSNSGTPDSGNASFNMPDNSALWIKAMSTKTGSSNSPVVSAQYHTVSQPTWIQPLGGYWGDDFNWQNSVIGNAAGVVVNFSSLTLPAPATITNDVAHTIGGLLFGDNGNTHGWTINGTSTLTLAGTSPAITVNNQSATITAPLAGTDPVSKAGPGTLILGNPTYTGSTTVTQGSLVLSNPASAAGNGTGGFRTAGFSIAAGSTLEFALTTDYRTPNNGTSITGAGSLVKSGSGALVLGGNSTDYANSVSLDPGTLIDIQGGSIRLDYAYNKTTWASNKADMRIAAGATFDIWDYGNTGSNFVKIDALTGAGTIQRGVTAPTTTGGLEIGVDNGSGNFSGVIQNGVGSSRINLRKSGTGIQTLAGANTYTGTTTVSGGMLTLTGSLLLKPTTNGVVNTIGGTAGLVLDGTLILDLSTANTTSGNQWLLVDVSNLNESYTGNFGLKSGTDSFTETTPGSGVWTLTSSSNLWTFTKSTGILDVAPANGFQSWMDSFTSLTALADKLPTADPDHDGFSNIIEFLLNGDPTSGAMINSPTVTASGNDLVFTFTRRDDAASLNPFVEFSTGLTGTWSKAQNGVNCTIIVQPNGTNPDTVTVTIPKDANTRLFARLAVSL